MSSELTPKYPILIVDDEEHFLNSMKLTLKSNGITNIECCRDSRQVMWKVKEKKYSLILLDMLMPYIKGDDLLKQIVESYKEIPVVMLTACNELDVAVRCMKIGARDYLVKPMDVSDFLNKIQSILGNSSDSSEPISPNNIMRSILYNIENIFTKRWKTLLTNEAILVKI